MNNEKCHFNPGGESCTLLMYTSCDGTNEECSFYKTEEQFREAADRAITVNRQKRRCESCHYVTKKCQLYSEKNKVKK